MRFRLTARRSHTRATSTRSKRPARTTKFSSCRSAEAPRRKFPPVPAPTPRRSIRRTENISPGVRKRAPASKPINGGSSCKIDNQGKTRDLTEKFDRSIGSFAWSSRFNRVAVRSRGSWRCSNFRREFRDGTKHAGWRWLSRSACR